MPVDENVLSDYVRDHLQGDLVGRGIVLNREVQLRPSVAPGTGQRTDIHIDATAKDVGRQVFETLTIVVEVKGAWNPELFTAMKTQLRDRYLSGTRMRRGLYLVGWFASALWRGKDARRARIPRVRRDALVKRLEKQARDESTDGIRIEALVLDATLPGENRRKTPRASGTQDSPATPATTARDSRSRVDRKRPHRRSAKDAVAKPRKRTTSKRRSAPAAERTKRR